MYKYSNGIVVEETSLQTTLNRSLKHRRSSSVGNVYSANIFFEVAETFVNELRQCCTYSTIKFNFLPHNKSSG